jgi:hypothetical protein
MRELLALQLAHLSSDGKVEPGAVPRCSDCRSQSAMSAASHGQGVRRLRRIGRLKNGHEGGEPKE